MPRQQTIIEALQEFDNDNPLTRAGQYWSADNAQFEGGTPTLLDRAGRALNPMTGFGSAMGAMQDAASQGSVPQAGLALLQALPLFGSMRAIGAGQGAVKAATGSIPDLQKLLIHGGLGTAISVGADEAQAASMRKPQ